MNKLENTSSSPSSFIIIHHHSSSCIIIAVSSLSSLQYHHRHHCFRRHYHGHRYSSLSSSQLSQLYTCLLSSWPHFSHLTIAKQLSPEGNDAPQQVWGSHLIDKGFRSPSSLYSSAKGEKHLELKRNQVNSKAKKGKHLAFLLAFLASLGLGQGLW